MACAEVVGVLRDLELCSDMLDQNKAVNFCDIEEKVNVLLQLSLSIEDCLSLFNCTSKPFVHFQICKLLKSILLRHFESYNLEILWSSFSNFLKNMNEIPYYVETSLIDIFSLILKLFMAGPSWFEGSSADVNALITDFLNSGELFMRKRGYLLMKAVINEISSDSSNISIGITCEKHKCIKVSFQSSLKKFVTICASSLAYYCQLDDNQWIVLLPSILSVMNDIFSWKFFEVNPTSQSASWYEVICQLNLPETFFKIFDKVRVINSDLAIEVFQCAAQLTSTKGDVLPDRVKKCELATNLVIFILSSLSVQDTNRKEIYGISAVVQSLISNYSSDIFQIDKQILIKFLSIIGEATFFLCQLSEEDDRIVLEALDNFLQSWFTILNNAITIQDGDVVNLLKSCLKKVFQIYLKGHLTAPEGTRNMLDMVAESQVEYSNEIEDAKDEVMYSDHLAIVGMLGRLSIEENLELTLKCLYSTTERLKSVFMSESKLNLTNIYEDVHWLLLLLSELISDKEGIHCMIPIEIIRFSHSLKVEEQINLKVNTTNVFISITQWIGIFIDMEVEAQRLGLMERFSPLLESSFLGFMARFFSAYVMYDEDNYYEISMCLAMLFGSEGKLSSNLLQWMLEKVYFNLKVWTSEEEVIEKTINLFQVVSSNKERSKICLKLPTFWQIVEESFGRSLQMTKGNKIKLLTKVFTTIPMSDTDVPLSLEKVFNLIVGQLKEITCSLKKSNSPENLRKVHANLSGNFDWWAALLTSSGTTSYYQIFRCFASCWVDITILVDALHSHDEIFEESFNIYLEASQSLVPLLEQDEVVELLQSFVALVNIYAKHTSGTVRGTNFEIAYLTERVLNNVLATDTGGDPRFSILLTGALSSLTPFLDAKMLEFPEGSTLFSSLIVSVVSRNFESFLTLEENHCRQLMILIENILLGKHNVDVIQNGLDFVKLFSEGLSKNQVHLSSCIILFGQRLMEIVFYMSVEDTTNTELFISIGAALCGLVILFPQLCQKLIYDFISKFSNAQQLLERFNSLSEALRAMSVVESEKNRVQHSQCMKSLLYEIRRLTKM